MASRQLKMIKQGTAGNKEHGELQRFLKHLKKFAGLKVAKVGERSWLHTTLNYL
jgi:hypothetical protein